MDCNQQFHHDANHVALHFKCIPFTGCFDNNWGCMEIKPNALAIRTLNSINRKRRLQQLHSILMDRPSMCVCVDWPTFQVTLRREHRAAYWDNTPSQCTPCVYCVLKGVRSGAAALALTMQPFRPLTALNANLPPRKAALGFPATAKRVQVTTTPSLLWVRAREMCVRRVFIIWCVGCISFNVFSLFSRGSGIAWIISAT